MRYSFIINQAKQQSSNPVTNTTGLSEASYFVNINQHESTYTTKASPYTQYTNYKNIPLSSIHKIQKHTLIINTQNTKNIPLSSIHKLQKHPIIINTQNTKTSPYPQYTKDKKHSLILNTQNTKTSPYPQYKNIPFIINTQNTKTSPYPQYTKYIPLTINTQNDIEIYTNLSKKYEINSNQIKAFTD